MPAKKKASPRKKAAAKKSTAKKTTTKAKSKKVAMGLPKNDKRRYEKDTSARRNPFKTRTT